MLSLLINKLKLNFKIKYGLLGALFIITVPLKAQQTPQFSQFIQNPFVLNPAITGVEDYSEVTVAHRNQWNGLDGAPKTTSFSLNTPLNNLKNSSLLHRTPNYRQGLGTFIYSDKTGPIKRSTFNGSYAYHLKISNDWHLSLGTFLGLNQFSFDNSNVVLVQNQNDVLIQNFSTTHFELGLGLYAYSKYLFAGIAANQLLNDTTNIDLELSSDLQTSYNLLLGSRVSLKNNFQLVPFILAKTIVNAPVQFEFGSKLTYSNKIWAGISYRRQDAVIGFLGFRFLENITFSYSYDAATTDFNNSQNGTHEIIIGYRFSFKKSSCNCPIYSL